MTNIAKIIRNNNSVLMKDMGLNFLIKPISLLVSLLYTPILLNYLGVEKYGIWATILSILNWITNFDVGIGNGLRNILVGSLVNGDRDTCQKDVSTAYISVTGIAMVLLIIGIVAGGFFEWEQIFGTSENVELVLVISFVYVCINFILKLCTSQLLALQKSVLVSFINLLIQLVNLCGVVCLSKIYCDGLISISILFGMSSLIIYSVFTVYLWRKYSFLIPRISCFCKQSLEKINNFGLKMFAIQISAIVLFSTDNIIITALYGAEAVTPYSTVFNVFNSISSLFGALLVPIWSRVTLAKEKKEYKWIENTEKKLELICIPFALILIMFVLLYKPIAAIWLGRDLIYDKGLILCMAIYYISSMFASIYSSILNGIGIIKIQMLQAIIAAFINIPLSIFLAQNCGLRTTGVCMATAIGYIIGNFVFKLQLKNFFRRNRSKVVNEKNMFDDTDTEQR